MQATARRMFCRKPSPPPTFTKPGFQVCLCLPLGLMDCVGGTTGKLCIIIQDMDTDARTETYQDMDISPTIVMNRCHLIPQAHGRFCCDIFFGTGCLQYGFHLLGNL